MRNMYEIMSVIGKLDPASQSTSEKLTDAIPVKNHKRFLFILSIGAMGSSGTIDFQVKGATSSGGSYTAISSTAITQLTQTPTDNSNSVVVVEISAEKIKEANAAYTHIKGSMVPGTAASVAGITCLAGYPSYTPGVDFDLATVLQYLAVVN